MSLYSFPIYADYRQACSMYSLVRSLQVDTAQAFGARQPALCASCSLQNQRSPDPSSMTVDEYDLELGVWYKRSPLALMLPLIAHCGEGACCALRELVVAPGKAATAGRPVAHTTRLVSINFPFEAGQGYRSELLDAQQ